MAQNVTVAGTSFNAVPSVTLPKQGGGTAEFYDTTIASDAAAAGDITSGKKAYVNGALVTGTATAGTVVIHDEADIHGGTIRHITAGDVVQGTINITTNGTHDVAAYADANVSVSASPNLQSKTKTYTPTESQQTETITAGTGYDGLSSVGITVNAISSSYVGSGVARRDSSNLSASGATVSVPSGYYESNASKAITSGSATPAASISATGASVSTGTNTLTLSKSISNAPQVSAGYISAGTAGNSSVSLTASIPMQAAQTIYPSGTDQTISSGRYLTGAQTIKGVTTANLTADNIKNGVTVTVGDSADADRILSVTGTYEGGGGGGDTWTWMGRNPVKVTTLPVENLSFADLGLDSWTYSTTATTLRSAEDYTTTTACDLANYDYITVTSVKVHYEYDSSWTGTVAPTDFVYWYAIATYRYILGYSAAMSGTPDYNGATSTMSEYRLLTRNSKYGSYAYGLYSSTSPGVTISSTSSTTPTVTWKKPSISAKGSSAYFPEAAYNNLDFDNSYYELTTEIWRVDAGTSDKGNSMWEVYSLLGIN